MAAETALFTRSLPVRKEFSTVLDDALYQPAPDDWLIAVTDVVGSRKAIAEGHYKAVNMAGVAMISALMNALETQDLPFIFGGDGAAVICAPCRPRRCCRHHGQDRHLGEGRSRAVPCGQPSCRYRWCGPRATTCLSRRRGSREAVNNFAFRGGGISHAEELMKAGEYAVPPALPGSRPDLTGLSCRWSPISPEGRSIVSIIIEAGAKGLKSISAKGGKAAGSFRHADCVRSGSPMPKGGPYRNLAAEGHRSRSKGHARRAFAWLSRKPTLYLGRCLAWILFKTGIPVGGFDPKRYKEFTSLNTDYRKFQDGLRITVSLGDTELEKLTEFLENERKAKNLRYGLCVQDSAILTCYVPSVTSDSHFHFLDGAGGGYAQAAENMKS